jgi:VWFA-related protein
VIDRDTATAPPVVPSLPATQPELHARLKPVLNRGTRMEVAAEGSVMWITSRPEAEASHRFVTPAGAAVERRGREQLLPAGARRRRPLRWAMRSPIRHMAAAVALAIAAAAPSSGQTPGEKPFEKPFTERVDVHRVLLDVRVTDGVGQALEDLTKVDFVVRIDGKPAPVESAAWVTGALRGEETAAPPGGSAVGTMTATIEGRLVVLLIQKDLDEPSRIVGLMQLLIDARPFFAAFTPRDRVAVLSFDSRLRIWSDFTNDLERVRTLLRHDLLMGQPAPLAASDGPSLVASIPAREAQGAATMEKALALVGRALERLPGAKSVIVFGHGFGRFGSGGVTLAPEYAEAQRSLRAARASVFCLDVTRADYHSLEFGLQQVAEDTGGFFERTHLFPARALNRLAGALAGHYVLMVEGPPARKGRHRVEVSVPHRSATVLVRDFVD